MSDQYEIELWQGGICVATVASADPDQAMREALHYVSVYAPDGPVEMKFTAENGEDMIADMRRILGH